MAWKYHYLFATATTHELRSS